jgi:transposase
MATTKIKKYTYHIGIDVSKDKLDFAVMSGRKLLFHKEIENNVAAILSFIKELKGIDNFTIVKAVFGMEQTGIYTNHLLQVLKKIRASVVLEDALQIRNSLGKLRGKYDKIDAIRIATYLYRAKDDLRLLIQRRPVIDELAHLATLRSRLIKMQKAMKLPLKEQKVFFTSSLYGQHTELCKESLQSIKNDIAKVERYIIKTVNLDEKIKRLYIIITSVPGVGPITALQIIITSNEFKDISDPKKFASYAGIAPFRKESGNTIKKPSVSYMANKKIKSLLHTCAISSISRTCDLQDYYFKKTKDEGKPAMAVLNAIRNKLVLRIFACVNQDRCFVREYVRVKAD